MRRLARLVICVSVAASLTSAANAAITNGTVTGGDSGGAFFKLVPPLSNPFGPPNSVGNDTFQDNNLYGFDEGQNILITVDLNVDDLADGAGGGSGPGILPAGTVVASHYVFFDPGPAKSVQGFVEFDSDILAVLSSTDNMAASDFLIHTGVNYLNPHNRGLEPMDFITIMDLQRIDVGFYARTPGDYVRVLTAFSPGALIPEPTTFIIWSLLAALAIGAGWWRKRGA